MTDEKPKAAERGWMYLDCLLGMAVSAMVFAPTLFCLATLVRLNHGGMAAAEARDNVQAVISVLARLIRSAGCNPMGMVMHPVRFQGQSTLITESDLGGDPNGLPDGQLDDAFERVTIQWDASTRQVTLASGAGSRQPLARQIGCLILSGLDRKGNPTSQDEAVVYVQLEICSWAEAFPGFPGQVREIRWLVRLPILSRLETGP